ncbi:amidohydrolase family protein [Terriglobus albidus]|uniref:amidohydrolase family protein n=1 Tax=Terriglobus albidus TaxID=1592106 RepID=UPI001C9BFFE7|nr:amidohydrolase family protein [Terriglobus albidus]
MSCVRRRTFSIAAVCFSVSTFLAGVQAQERVEDRRAFIWPQAATSDDPRHIPIRPEVTVKKPVLVLRGGRVFDSVKTDAYAATVVMEGKYIKSILPPQDTNWPTDAKVVDVTDKTVMPGLIDLHVHITYPDSSTPVDEQASEGAGVLRGLTNLRYFIESGFTTVRDMNGVLNAPFLLSEWMAEDRAPGPRVFAAGHIITGTGGHAADRPISPIHSSAFAQEVDGPDEWRKAVRQNFKNGANVIKIASIFSPGEVRAAVEEAHALGLRVTCDCETFYIRWAIEAGVDMIEHPLPRTDETIRLMAQHHTDADPTLQVYQSLLDSSGGYYGVTSRRFTLGSQQDFDVFKKMKAAGIRLGVGTDTIGNANAFTPNTYIAELKWFVKGGYTPSGALIAATRTNAQMLDVGDKLGTLEPGKLADVIVVDGKPDQNLDDLKQVSMVIRDGLVMVDHGQINVPPHVPKPLLKASPPENVH